VDVEEEDAIGVGFEAGAEDEDDDDDDIGAALGGFEVTCSVNMVAELFGFAA